MRRLQHIQGKEFYIPHKPAARGNVESTKMKIVYDASTKSNRTSPSLNECLETALALQNLLWNTLVRNRLMPIALHVYIKQAFFQTCIKEKIATYFDLTGLKIKIQIKS